MHPPQLARTQFYKLYKDGRPPPSLEDVIDVDRPDQAGVDQIAPPIDAPEWLRAARVYALRGVDGFRLLRAPLSADQQLQLVEAALAEWIEPPVVTNLDLHHGPCARLWATHRSDPEGSFFPKLSWATLGQHYRWTERAYEPARTPDTFPPALAALAAELAAAVGFAVRPDSWPSKVPAGLSEDTAPRQGGQAAPTDPSASPHRLDTFPWPEHRA